MAGATAYISLVEVPGRADKPHSYQLENYQEIFPRAMNLLRTSGMVAAAFTAVTGYLTEKPEWFVSVACSVALGPFTAIFIAPTNEILMAAKDASKVKKELEAWGKLHNVRTYIMMAGFSGAICAAMDLKLF